MSKKLAIVFLGAMLLLGCSFNLANAQGITIRQFVELLISMGVISPEKAAVARSAVYGAPSVPPPNQANSSSCISLARNLSLGSQGTDVKFLQNKLGIIPGTGYYGSLTESAVKAFQKGKSLKTTGAIDVLSREKFNALYGCPSQVAVSASSNPSGSSRGGGGGGSSQIARQTSTSVGSVLIDSGNSASRPSVQISQSPEAANTASAPANQSSVQLLGASIAYSLSASSSCIAPGAKPLFYLVAKGTGLESIALEKSVNGGAWNSLALWNAGPIDTPYSIDDVPSGFEGTYALRLLINGQAVASKSVKIASNCEGNAASSVSATPETPSSQTVTPPISSPSANQTSDGNGPVCNTNLIGSNGYDSLNMISLGACQKLNQLYAAGKAAGNTGDIYDNRDGLHVNLCVGWTPNPDCPAGHRLFPQHDWVLSGSVGRATSPFSRPTLGQASWSGEVDGSIKHSIPYSMYKSQSGANTLYNLYANNNLYVYPSLYEDTVRTPENPVDIIASTENIANTPYVIGSKQICKCGADAYRIHDASGSDLPFIELGFAGLAAFQPQVKSALISKGMLMSTLQSMIRRSHESVSSEGGYLTSVAHRSSVVAHRLSGEPKPLYSADKLVSLANSLSLNDVPPVVNLSLVSENFSDGEKLFSTPEAIARSAPQGVERTISVSASAKDAIDGGGHEYQARVLSGDASLVNFSLSSGDPARLDVTFMPGYSTQRIDVGIFSRKTGSAYYSVPSIVSVYIR